MLHCLSDMKRLQKESLYSGNIAYMHEQNLEDTQGTEYLFGDSDTAAHRLDILAEVFEPSTRSFLAEIRPTRLGIALDLGCGRGHTTQLISTVLRFPHTVGLDNSKQFLDMANRDYASKISFILHDVTQVPFPIDGASVIYARFLTTHLDDPKSVVLKWGTQLVSGGLLLLDEVEFINTSHPVFDRYLSWVDSLLKHRGCSLYIGPELATADFPGILEPKLNRIRRFRVSDRDAATMFLLNVDAWADHPFIVSTHGSGEVKRMAEELKEVIEFSALNSNIEWGMRQIAFERI